MNILSQTFRLSETVRNNTFRKTVRVILYRKYTPYSNNYINFHVVSKYGRIKH